MKWTRPRQRSRHLQDRRGPGGLGRGGFGGGRFSRGGYGRGPVIARGGKVGVPAVLALLAAVFFGADLFGGAGYDVYGGYDQFPAASQPAGGGGLPREADPDADLADFTSVVLDDVQQSWDEQFAAAGRSYQPATLVLFTGGTETGCGLGSAAVGPFYCPADETVYIDLEFFRDLQDRYAAPGDFAQAYVIAHEIGHHVQNLLGISSEVRRLQQSDPEARNDLSVRQELQADCLAGVWAYSTYERELLERGDLEEGLAAAAAVGDDRLQRQAGGQVTPETWTHGSSEQRRTWFRRGFEDGDLSACDTFSA